MMMLLITFLALLFGFIALFIILALFFCMYKGVVSSFDFSSATEALESYKLKRKKQLLEKADKMLEDNNLNEALGFLCEAWVFDTIPRSNILIKDVVNHNFSVFNRLLSYAENRSIQIENIEMVEELLEERLRILTLAHESGVRFSQNRGKVGKVLWAKEEFQKQRNALADKLRINEKLLRKNIDEIYERLTSSINGERVIYH